jgi:acyl carrier protein
MSDDLFEPVRLLVAEVMEVAPEEVARDSTNTSLERWDSLRHLKLIAALGDTFDIEIDDDEIEDCLAVAGILDLVAGKLSDAAA